MGQIEKSALDSVPNDQESSRARPVGCDDAHRTHSDGHPLLGAETGPRSTRTTASSRTRSFGGRAELALSIEVSELGSRPRGTDHAMCYRSAGKLPHSFRVAASRGSRRWLKFSRPRACPPRHQAARRRPHGFHKGVDKLGPWKTTTESSPGGAPSRSVPRHRWRRPPHLCTDVRRPRHRPGAAPGRAAREALDVERHRLPHADRPWSA